MEREKALDMAVGQIEKQYGKGAVMRLGDQANQKVASIPTGAISLDLALGVGGIPRGRVTEIYGPEASGKCLSADSYVWTDQGLETVEEVFERCGEPARCTSRVTDVRTWGVRAVNERGELEGVAALTHNNLQPVIRLRLRTGRTVEVTHNHPLRIVSERGFLVWREAGEIREGDTVVSAAFGAEEAAEGAGLDEDEAVLLGYLVAEGSLSQRHQVWFPNSDPEVGAEFSDLMRWLFDVEPPCYAECQYVAGSRTLRNELEQRYGLGFGVARDKHVPHCVRTAGAKVQRAFLSALFEGDGWIDGSSTIGYASASEELARQVQLLLLGLGIPASLASKWNPRYERFHWTVTINPACVGRFIDEIGFRSARRQRQVEESFRRSDRDPQLENVPHVANLVRDLRDTIGGDREFDRIAGDLFRGDMTRACSRTRLQRIVAWAEKRESELSFDGRAILEHLRVLAEHRYIFEQVEEIEDAGEKPTFDLMLPETHSFLANGVLSHNTTVALHVVAEAQQAGGIAAFIDAEHALDPSYAKALGVDTEELLVSQPDTGEQALEIADMLVRSGAVDVIVIDSVAALTPKAEIEGEMGDSHVGLQARLMSQALRKLSGTLHRSRTSAVFINQLREKVGVMFGCFNYSTRVTLADGTQEKIGTIVDQRRPVEVLSYDAERDEVVAKKVTNWFDNGPTDGFLRFTVDTPSNNGGAQFACTPNHLIRTPGGWREAAELCEGDRVLQTVTTYLSNDQWEVVLGSVMGDGALSPTRSGHGARLRFGHRADQAYAEWKASLFSNVGVSRRTDERGAVFYDVQPLPELGELRDTVALAGKNTISEEHLKQLTPRSLAVWYMDSGDLVEGDGEQAAAEIEIETLHAGSWERLRSHLQDAWGLEAELTANAGTATFRLTEEATHRLHDLIAPHVPPSMQHKLLPEHRGRFADRLIVGQPTDRLMPLPITSVTWEPAVNEATHRYDLEVDGTHNYFVDGVMVHNSPETTPGGRALKFYSSVRLDVRRIESLKDGNDAIGNRVRVKVVKNKCVAAGTRVVDAASGETRPIEDIVENQRPITVWAADKAGKLHEKPVTGWFDQGEQEVVPLVLGDGTSVRVTHDHLMLTDSGWRPAGELAVGDLLARPRIQPDGEPNASASTERLPAAYTAPVLQHLGDQGMTAERAAALIGELGAGFHEDLGEVLGGAELRRDRLQAVNAALASSFLSETLDEDVFYDRIEEIGEPELAATYDIEVADLHNFVAEDVVVHNCAPPFRQAEFDIMYGTGISKEGALLDLGVDHGVVKKAGAWYTYEGEQLGQGRENAKKFLAEHDDVTQAITKQLHEQLGLVPTDVTGDEAADGDEAANDVDAGAAETNGEK